MSALKLGFLLIRTIAKPIANSIKSYSKTHPKFREACIGVAQFSHKTEMQLKMKFLGYKVEAIRPLNDARAVEMGANFLGEAIIFGVAGSLIFVEQARSRRNAKDRRNYVDDTLDSLLMITEELREEVKEISQSSEQKIALLQQENVQLRRTLNEILDVSLRLRSHTQYSGQEVGLGNTTGGFFLEIQGPSKDEEGAFTPSSVQQQAPQPSPPPPQPEPSPSQQPSTKSPSRFEDYHHDISESFKHHRDAYERPSDQDYIVVNFSSQDQHDDHHHNNSHHQQSLEKKASVFSLPSSWSFPSLSRSDSSSSASDASSSSTGSGSSRN
ncbi:hypothetical protein DFQ26_006436 [Actinomortierella ambigua]|nr:hypothetical protein DFQ26_006436 [Actinomortierella ambigua]